MDRIYVSGIQVYGHHGHTEEERRIGQTLLVDVELVMDVSAAGASDKLEHTADYGQVYTTVCQIVSGGSQRLLEHIATDIAKAVLETTPAIEAVVRVWKPHPPVGGPCARCGVEITRRAADFEDHG